MHKYILNINVKGDDIKFALTEYDIQSTSIVSLTLTLFRLSLLVKQIDLSKQFQVSKSARRMTVVTVLQHSRLNRKRDASVQILYFLFSDEKFP